MNKQHFIDAVAKKAGVEKKVAANVVEAFTNVVTDALVDGDSVKLVGFGTFETVERAAREGRNPKTGETVYIQASKAPKFRSSSALKSAVK